MGQADVRVLSDALSPGEWLPVRTVRVLSKWPYAVQDCRTVSEKRRKEEGREHEKRREVMIEQKTIRAQRDVSPLPSEPHVTDQAAMFNNPASGPWRCLNLVPSRVFVSSSALRSL